MCVYCNMGDHSARFDPPWPDFWRTHPAIPRPLPSILPQEPWSLERLKEYAEVLRMIKELEDKLGCPCEPNKADYLSILKARIEALEKKAAP